MLAVANTRPVKLLLRVAFHMSFALKQSTVDELNEGEVLCKTLFLSLDPYMRSQIAGRHITAPIKPGDLMLVLSGEADKVRKQLNELRVDGVVGKELIGLCTESFIY